MSCSAIHAGKRAVYPAYKPSEIELIGNIPENWDVCRLKYIATINDEALKETTDPDYEFTYVDIGGVDAVKGIVATDIYRFEDAPSRARRIVRDGDTIVSTVRTYLRAIAPIRDPDDNLIVSTGFAVVRPRRLDPDYLSYALRSPSFIETVVSRSTGVSYPAINAPEVGNIWITIPPLDEQQSIATFLDREKARVDALIKTKQRQISLLLEKRLALISHAVTKGLDPDIPMQDSGVEWLGEVPKHWDVVAYKRVCTRVDVGIAEAATHAYCDDGVPIIRSTNVKPNRLETTDLLRIEPWFAEKNRSKTLRAGDLVTVRTGYPGTTAIIPESLDGAQCFTLVLSSPRRTTHGPYFSWVFNSQQGRSYFEMEGWGTAQTNISVPIVQSMPVPRPPFHEQIAIASYLDEETAKVDELVAKVTTAIQRLYEYSTALISAAVTGKIDVRGEVA